MKALLVLLVQVGKHELELPQAQTLTAAAERGDSWATPGDGEARTL